MQNSDRPFPFPTFVLFVSSERFPLSQRVQRNRPSIPTYHFAAEGGVPLKFDYVVIYRYHATARFHGYHFAPHIPFANCFPLLHNGLSLTAHNWLLAFISAHLCRCSSLILFQGNEEDCKIKVSYIPRIPGSIL